MLRLQYYGTTTVPLEAECITPDALAGKSSAEVAALAVQHGNRQMPLAEFFRISGSAADGEILVEGDCSRVKLMGSGMTYGKLTVQGPVGMHLGAEMRGGLIETFGAAGDWVGAEMRGGRIHVHGNAGHLIGAGYRGSRTGMRGGTIMIDGNVGNEIGSAMRRGLIAIGGTSGDYSGISLIAGSIFLFGAPGIRLGAGMKRGTIAVFADMPPLLPSFRRDCDYSPIFMSLYLRQLQAWGMQIPPIALNGTYRRYSGDLVALGKGEILHWHAR